MRNGTIVALIAYASVGCIVQTESVSGEAGPSGTPGASPFTASANGDIYYDDGRVGIGTSEPICDFNVHSQGDTAPSESGYTGVGHVRIDTSERTDKSNYDSLNTSSTILMSLAGDENDTKKAATLSLSQFNAVSTISVLYTSTYKSALTFATSRGDGIGGSGVPVEAVRITDSGHVGVGTMAPTTMLDVNGVVTATAIRTASLGKITLYRGATTIVDVPWTPDDVASQVGATYIWTANGPNLRDIVNCNNGADPSAHIDNVADLAHPGRYIATFATCAGFPCVQISWAGWELQLWSSNDTQIKGPSPSRIDFELLPDANGDWAVEIMFGTVGDKVFSCL